MMFSPVFLLIDPRYVVSMNHFEARDHMKQSQTELAEEAPVSVTFNGVAHVVMMMSPLDIADFVIGFSLTEGLIDQASDIEGIEICDVEFGLLADARIPSECFDRLARRRRNLPGQASCGICGIIELEAAMPELQAITSCPLFSKTVILKAVDDLENHQPLQDRVQAVHTAAFVNKDGNILLAREDIGRHNALDKLIGALAQSELSPEDGFVLMSSRCSVELVQKTVKARIPLLASLSAPTTLAAGLARSSGLTLFSWAGRKRKMSCVSDPFDLYA
jgi:FdhD protein